MKISKEKGITLVVLVITVIILIIISGVSIHILLGNDGVTSKAKNSANTYKEKIEEQEIKLAVIEAAKNNNGKLSITELSKELNNQIGEGNYSIELNNSTGDFTVTIDKKEYNISANGTVSTSRTDNEENDEEDNSSITKIVSYSPDSYTATTNKFIHLEDLTGNGNYTTLYNTSVTEDGKGLIFNGSSSYGEIFHNTSLNFPLTIEATFSCTEYKDGFIYFDTYTKTVLSFYNRYIIATIDATTNVVNLPENFDNGEIYHIVITYTSKTNFEVYINGVKQEKSTSTDYWGDRNCNYIGTRYGDTSYYLKGILYTLRVYSTNLSDSQILASYTADINMLNNNSSNISRENLYLEYVVKENNDQSPTVLLDQSGHGNNATCYNVYYNRTKNSFMFNGNSSYAEISMQEDLAFPLTFEFTLSSTKLGNSVIYANPNLNVVIGFWEGYLCITKDTDAPIIYYPSNIEDGRIVHLVITYNTLTDFEVYINGVKQEKSTSVDCWEASESKNYICRRYSGNYFYGTLYEINIYEGIMKNTTIQTRYQKITTKYQ